MSQPSASAATVASSTARLFRTGRAPGRPRQTGQRAVFGSAPNRVEHPQKILVAVSSCAWISRPITGSKDGTGGTIVTQEAWGVDRGSWVVERRAWGVDRGSWIVERRAWFVERWAMTDGRGTVNGRRTVNRQLQTANCRPRTADRELQTGGCKP